MTNNINCTCGHSWSKASSSKKDMYVCHICGKDNTMQDGGWLSKFEQGGMTLEQNGDNYGKKANPNNVDVSMGPDFVGLGYDTTGRNYSPAWGGQFEDGGNVAQGGKSIPTTADSLALYNTSKKVLDYYKNKKYQDYSNRDYKKKENYKRNNRDALAGFLDLNKSSGIKVLTDTGKKSEIKTIPVDSYYKKLDGNRYLQREQFYGALDTNAPMQLFDNRITPTILSYYANEKVDDPLYKDNVSIYSYDPILVKPVSMLTSKERALRLKRYGKASGLTDEKVEPSTSTEKSKIEPEKKKTSVIKKSEETKPAPYTPKGSKKYIVNGIEVSEEDFLGSGNTTGGSKRIIYSTPKLEKQKVLRLDGTPETDPEKIRKAMRAQKKDDEFQNGGNLWNTNKTAWVDSIHNARKGDLNFVQRMFDQSAGSIQIPGERGTSTHYMESGDGKAYPTVVQMPNGKLQYLNQNDKNAAWNYANKTGQFIKFPNDEQAEWYANNGYKKGTNVLKKAMGGSLPGAVGFTYARTINPAPSNGKYAKKTKASAQDGISTIDSKVKEGKNFLEQMANSPLFAERYANMTGKSLENINKLEIDNYRNKLLNNLKTVNVGKPNEYPGGQEDGNFSMTAGEYWATPYNSIQKPHTIYVRPGMTSQATVTHELSHSTNVIGDLLANSPKFEYDPSLTEEYKETFEKARPYYTNPTEVKARRDAIGQYMMKKGLWNPITEKFTSEHYDKLKEIEEGLYEKLKKNEKLDPEELDVFPEFQHISLPYKKDETIRIFNSFVKNNSKLDKNANKAQNGKEMKYYQEGFDFKPNNISEDGAIVDPMGQWAHPGEVTIIPGTDITMEGVDYPVLGISDTGDQQMMYPGEDYDFDGEYVTEYPIMKEGGWLSKFDTAQGGGTFMSNLISKEDANLNKNRGDMASYFPEIKRMKDKPEMDKAITKADQKRKQNILAEAVARGRDKQATVTQDNRTPRQKEIAQQQLVNLTIDEAQRTSPLAQTFSSFTPTGDNPEAGKTAAVNFVDATPPMAMLRLMNTARDVENNPYGIGQGNGFLANTLGTLGLVGDVFDAGSIFNPRLGSAIKQSTPLKILPKKVGKTSNLMMNDVAPNVKSAWEPQELPGLHLSSTMEGGPISKIVEPKTGLVNVEQALGIIAKESGGASKASLIKKALGKDTPKKMDYNDFRKTVQDQLIPLEREVVNTFRSAYNIDKLGYTKASGDGKDIILNRINNTKEEIRGLEASGESNDYLDILKANLEIDLRDYNNLPLENQTIRLSNKDKFGRGSDVHGNPEETLGHIHFLRDAESPDILTMTQLQSDAFQSTNRTMPKSLEEAGFSLQSLENIVSQRNNVLESLKKQKEELLINKADKETIGRIDEEIDTFTKLIEDQNAFNKFNKAEVENFAQKSLLDKNHQERYLQELVDYAGKRGDVNKVRVPTSETAAKVQGYRGVEAEEIIKRYNEEIAKNPNYTKEITEKSTENEIKLINDVLNGKKKGMVYEPEAQTILKKYTEQPKLIKKLFGVEPKIVTDSKGNTWYEFDIPDKFKGGKGEIKAFKDGGWLTKYK